MKQPRPSPKTKSAPARRAHKKGGPSHTRWEGPLYFLSQQGRLDLAELIQQTVHELG